MKRLICFLFRHSQAYIFCYGGGGEFYCNRCDAFYIRLKGKFVRYDSSTDVYKMKKKALLKINNEIRKGF